MRLNRDTDGPICIAFRKSDGCVRCGLEFCWDGHALVAIFSFEDAEVQVRSAGKAGIPGMSNELSGRDDLSRYDDAAPFLEMAILGQSAVVVADYDVIVKLVIVHRGTAGVGIIFHFHHQASARGPHGSSLGHFPIDSVLIRPGVAESAVVALRHFKPGARGEGQLVDEGIIRLSAGAAEFEVIGIVKSPCLAGVNRFQ